MDYTHKDRSLFIKCECHGEGLGVDYDSKDDLYYFSYWSMGLSNKPLSWRQRIRYCWAVLTKGKAFNDEIMLNKAGVNQLSNFFITCEGDNFGLPKEYAPND